MKLKGLGKKAYYKLSGMFGYKDIPNYMKDAYNDCVRFTDELNPNYKGASLVFGKRKNLQKLIDLKELTEMDNGPGHSDEVQEKLEAYFKVNGRTVMGNLVDFLHIIGHKEPDGLDGAVLIDRNGDYAKSRMFIEGTRTNDIELFPGTGTRYRSCAWGSMFPGVDGVIVVGEKRGDVIMFRIGRSVEGYKYFPKKREEELYSEDLPKGE